MRLQCQVVTLPGCTDKNSILAARKRTMQKERKKNGYERRSMCLRVRQHVLNKYVRDALYRFVRYKSCVARGVNKQEWRRVSSLPGSRGFLFAYIKREKKRERERVPVILRPLGERVTHMVFVRDHGNRLHLCRLTALFHYSYEIYWWNKFSYVIISRYARADRSDKGNARQSVYCWILNNA